MSVVKEKLNETKVSRLLIENRCQINGTRQRLCRTDIVIDTIQLKTFLSITVFRCIYYCGIW